MTSTLGSFPPPTTAPVPAPPPATPRRTRTAGHVVAIVVGALALLPGFGLLAGGTTAAIAQAVATDDGYFTFTPDRITADGVAVVTDHEWFEDADGPWVLDWLDLDVRLRAEGAGPTDEVFVGIARTQDVEAYLDGAPYSVIDDLDGRSVRYRREPGTASVDAPSEVDIWVATADGAGEQELTWEARGGRWSMVMMNTDGSPDVAADVEIGAKSGAITPIAVTLIVIGGVTVVTAIGLIVFGVRGRREP
jgi:hypothetical protein